MLAGRGLLHLKHWALRMGKAIVDSDLEKKKKYEFFFFFSMSIFLGIIETCEMCIDKQLNQLFLAV